MNKKMKKTFFALIVITLILAIVIIVKIGKFEKLEGYMYSLAAEITQNATAGDATSSNATSSNATSCDATSSNARTDNEIKITNTESETVKIEAEPIEEKTEGDLNYNNSEITQEVLDKIIASKENQNIIINVDTKTNIDKKIFEAVKEIEKQLTIKLGENEIIFNGKDITNPKNIDASITYNLISEDTDFKQIKQKGIVVNFSDNGQLPGPATIRIKVTNEIRNTLDLKTIYVYYYNETDKELIKLSNNAVYTVDGFIEIAIDHNSKYIFVNEQIEENNNTNSINTTDNKVTFLESNKIYAIIILLSIFVIIFVVVILIIDKKTKGKVNK